MESLEDFISRRLMEEIGEQKISSMADNEKTGDFLGRKIGAEVTKRFPRATREQIASAYITATAALREMVGANNAEAAKKIINGPNE